MSYMETSLLLIEFWLTVQICQLLNLSLSSFPRGKYNFSSPFHQTSRYFQSRVKPNHGQSLGFIWDTPFPPPTFTHYLELSSRKNIYYIFSSHFSFSRTYFYHFRPKRTLLFSQYSECF